VIQKLIAQSLSLACPLDQSSDIEKLESGGNRFFRMDQARNLLQPSVGYGDNTNVRVDRAETVTCYLCAGSSQRIEQRGLPYVWKTHNAAPKSHLQPLTMIQQVRNSNSEMRLSGDQVIR